MESIVNKVAQSGIISIDPDDFYTPGPRVSLDLAACLWQGLVLREAEFREWVKCLDLAEFKGAHVAVHCSADALIPAWAYMLVASALSGVAQTVVQGSPEDLELLLTLQSIEKRVHAAEWVDARVVVKGCGKSPVHPAFHAMLAQKLTPVVKSLMFGEPCSTVPVFKKPKS